MRRRLTLAAATAAVAVALLAGCAANPYPAETADALQQKVLTVSQTIAAGDLAAARTQLDELQASIDAAHDDERLTTDRHDDIATAIALVRSDLDAALAQQAQQAAEAEAARIEQETALREQEEAQRQQEEAQREQQEKDDDDEKGKPEKPERPEKPEKGD